MVEFQPSKLAMRVRFPLPAPNLPLGKFSSALSSVGQSNRLITGGSKVRILEGAPRKYTWVGGRVAKGGRL